jgi:hypothetical protein
MRAAFVLAMRHSEEETPLCVVSPGWKLRRSGLPFPVGRLDSGPIRHSAVPLSTLALLLPFKGLAWSISLGNFRGGPTFPALFLGVVAGLLAAHLPGYGETQGVAVLTGAGCVSVLRLPLASVMIASLLCAKGGLALTPLVVVSVVVAYIATEALTAYVGSRVAPQAAETVATESPAPATL